MTVQTLTPNVLDADAARQSPEGWVQADLPDVDKERNRREASGGLHPVGSDRMQACRR
jgi:hypothetical protein